MKNLIRFVLSGLLLLSFVTAVLSQETGQIGRELSRIVLKEGNYIIGTIISETSDAVTVETANMGVITVKRSEIRAIEKIDTSKMKAGKYWFPTPNSTRYLFGPTGRNLEKGEGYFQNIDIFFNSAHYGITDWLSIGAGLEAISTFSGNPVFMIIPKVGFEITEKFSVGGGVFYVNAASIASGASGGIAYGVATYGSRESNASLGAGWFFGGGEIGSEPVITISGMHRISRRLALVSENWIIPAGDSYFLLTYGLRFMGERMSVDWAFINSKDIIKEFPLGFPFWVSFNVNL